MGDRVNLGLEAAAGVKDGTRLRGVFELECFDKDGNFKWRQSYRNMVVNEGLNHILDILFAGSTAVDPWYVGLCGSSPVPAAGHTMTDVTEFTSHGETARPVFTDVRTGQSVDNNAVKASFAITGTGTVGGAFLCSDDTVGGTGGTLLCYAAASEGNRSVANGDTINAKYTFTAADDGV
jgi:hypothetical protein